jgi:hypothetical protein
MTNYQHPITVPPELVQEWVDMLGSRSDQDVFTLVADWGSDRELQACCAQISQCHLLTINQCATIARYLHSCRRPKPPSLKEQAIKDLDDLEVNLKDFGMGFVPITNLRKALEALPND